MPLTEHAPHERLVTANEIADLLSVNPKWVYAACRLYDMPCYVVGRYKRFSPTEVFAWLRESGVSRFSINPERKEDQDGAHHQENAS